MSTPARGSKRRERARPQWVRADTVGAHQRTGMIWIAPRARPTSQELHRCSNFYLEVGAIVPTPR
eukprot:1811855-Pyramimonas_sp.AAC.1